MQTENWKFHLEEAKKYFKNANHLAYVTMTILKENRLLIKILLDIHKSAINVIKAYLEYEAQHKRVVLSNDPIQNLNIFLSKIAPKYLKKEELENLLRILKLARQHKDAPLEFVKKDKFVIFSNGSYETLTKETIKSLILALNQAISSFPLEA